MSLPDSSVTTYSPSLVGHHLQDPESKLYHASSADRAYLKMQEGKTFSTFSDQQKVTCVI